VRTRGVAAIVTGGASGLGGAVVDMLSAAGAKVSVFDLNQELGARILVQAIIENPMLNGETIRLHGAIRMAPK